MTPRDGLILIPRGLGSSFPGMAQSEKGQERHMVMLKKCSLIYSSGAFCPVSASQCGLPRVARRNMQVCVYICIFTPVQ